MITNNPAICLYAVFDRVQGTYSEPFAAATDGAAVRMFKNSLKRNPFDYGCDLDLMYLGVLDQITGEIELTENGKPKFIFRSVSEVDESGT